MNSVRFHDNVLYTIALRLCLVWWCAAIAISAEAQTPVSIPDTPAGKQLAAFLTAINTGKRAALRAFIDSNIEKPKDAPSFVDNTTDQNVMLYRQSHGYTVRKIKESAP